MRGVKLGKAELLAGVKRCEGEKIEKGGLTKWQHRVRIMPMKKTPHTLTDQLRRIVRESGMTLGELSQRTGIHKSALSRFLSGERGVSASVLDALGEYLGLGFTVKPKSKGRTRKGR